jgi:hypothetical protein
MLLSKAKISQSPALQFLNCACHSVPSMGSDSARKTRMLKQRKVCRRLLEEKPMCLVACMVDGGQGGARQQRSSQGAEVLMLPDS